jgi:hypothetical protein
VEQLSCSMMSLVRAQGGQVPIAQDGKKLKEAYLEEEMCN